MFLLDSPWAVKAIEIFLGGVMDSLNCREVLRFLRLEAVGKRMNNNLGSFSSEGLGAVIFDSHFALAVIFGYMRPENGMRSLQGIQLDFVSIPTQKIHTQPASSQQASEQCECELVYRFSLPCNHHLLPACATNVHIPRSLFHPR